jgi:subtilisin family serine protease
VNKSHGALMSACRGPVRNTAPPRDPLDLVGLRPLMALTAGRAEVVVGIVDGPVLLSQKHLTVNNIRGLGENGTTACSAPQSAACVHGTFVTGILAAQRGAPAPALCPDCSFIVRPIFAETSSNRPEELMADAGQLTDAIIEAVDAGARVINLSVALAEPSSSRQRGLEQALIHAAARGAILVAAAGNQATLGSSALTRHAWVIPVVAVDGTGTPISETNLGRAIGRNGLAAPGDRIVSLGPNEQPLVLGGTSAAAPFVTGAAALLWSRFPNAPAVRIMDALRHAGTQRRGTVMPPLLDAWAAHERLAHAM